MLPSNWRLESVGDWAADLYRTVALPDARLEKRLLMMVQTFAARPLDSINQACDDWAGAKGAYRFIENNAVTADSLAKPIRDAAARDSAGLETLVTVQDTTVLSFDRAREAKGLGPVNDSPDARGMLLHPVMAMRPDGVPVGLLNLDHWCRDLVPLDDEDKAKRTVEEKESFKWLRGIRASREGIESNLPEEHRPRLLHVFDREGDIHDVFDLVTASDDGAVIRCNHNRRVMTGDGRGALAHDAVHEAPLLGACMIAPRASGFSVPFSATART